MMERLDQLMVELKLIKDQIMSARQCKPSPMKTILLCVMNFVNCIESQMTTEGSHNHLTRLTSTPSPSDSKRSVPSNQGFDLHSRLYTSATLTPLLAYCTSSNPEDDNRHYSYQYKPVAELPLLRASICLAPQLQQPPNHHEHASH